MNAALTRMIAILNTPRERSGTAREAPGTNRDGAAVGLQAAARAGVWRAAFARLCTPEELAAAFFFVLCAVVIFVGCFVIGPGLLP